MVWWLFKRKEDRFDNLNKNLEHSFTNLKGEMNSVGKWINHFKEKHEKHDHKFDELFRKIGSVEEQIGILNERLEIQIKGYNDRSIAIERIQSFNRSDQSFMNVQSIRSIDNLTPAQKQVLALLVLAGGPLDYEDIATKLGLNIVTIRRHINDLKRAGIEIKEKVSVKNRRKLIYVDQDVKERIQSVEKKNKRSRSES